MKPPPFASKKNKRWKRLSQAGKMSPERMEHHHETVRVALRITGKDLDPGEISGLLRCEPTSAHRYGDTWTGPSGTLYEAGSGLWELEGNSQHLLEGQLEQILGQVEGDPEVWKGLVGRYRCSLMVEMEGLEGDWTARFSPENLGQLGAWGIPVTLEIRSSRQETG